MCLNVLGNQSHLLQRCHYHPATVVTKDLPISPLPGSRFRFLIAMQVQRSYNSSTNGRIFLTHVLTLSATEEQNKNPALTRIQLLKVIIVLILIVISHDFRRGGGGGVRCQTFYVFLLSLFSWHNRDWPPCSSFFRDGNQYVECEKNQLEYFLHRHPSDVTN